MSGPIFGASATTGGSSGSNRHLVEFRAGRMNMVGKMVHPDNRKGLVYVYQAEDGLIHFCWKDRTSGNIEDDLIIFPDDCEFKKVEQCKTGRVYLLKFKSSSRKLFFWMQEPKTDKDEEWTRRVNDVMNNPPSINNIGSSRSNGGSGNSDNCDLQYMLNNMSQQQLMQLFGGVGQIGGLSTLLGSMNRPSSGNSSSRSNTTQTAARGGTAYSLSSTPSTATTTTTPAVTATSVPSTPRAPKKTSKDKPVASGVEATTTAATDAGKKGSPRALLTELQNYLSGLTPARGTDNAGQREIDLSTAINSETINPIISNPETLNSLQVHLPNIETDDNIKEQLKDTLASPQFRQALSMFSSALQSGQLGPVVSQFQLNSDAIAAANSGDLEQFIKALENTNIKDDDNDEAASDSKKKDAKEEKKKDDDDNMTTG